MTTFRLMMRAGILTSIFLMPAATAFPARSLPTQSSAASASPAATVADELPTIVVPTGWTAKETLPTSPGAIYVGGWNAPPPNPADTITLSYIVIPPGKTVTLEAVAQEINAAYKKLVGAKNMVATHAERVCGGTTDGWYSENKLAIGTMNVVLEQTLLLGKTAAFVATYGRLDTEKEDPAARASLDTICVKHFERPTGISTDGEGTVYLNDDFSGDFDLQYAATMAPAPSNRSWSLVGVMLKARTAPSWIEIGLVAGRSGRGDVERLHGRVDIGREEILESGAGRMRTRVRDRAKGGQDRALRVRQWPEDRRDLSVIAPDCECLCSAKCSSKRGRRHYLSTTSFAPWDGSRGAVGSTDLRIYHTGRRGETLEPDSIDILWPAAHRRSRDLLFVDRRHEQRSLSRLLYEPLSYDGRTRARPPLLI
jgi:hypothetical protein